MEYYEKREYNDGCKYVRVFNLVPGVSYYTTGTDENNQIYFSPVHNPSMTSTVVPMMTDMSGGGGGGSTFVNFYPPPSTLLNMNSTTTRSLIINEDPQNEFEKGLNLHLGVTIASIFIPTLIYLIGFPFCFVKLRNLATKSSNENIEKNMKNYTAVGWTAWVLHLACLITLTTFWIPICHSEPMYYYGYYDYYNNNYYPGVYWQNICQISTAGFVMVGLIPICTLIFTIVLCVIGVVFFEDLKNGGDYSCANRVTVQ